MGWGWFVERCMGWVGRRVCGDACTHVEVKAGARYLSLSLSTLVVDISSPTEPGAPKSRDPLVSALLMLELQECSAAQLDSWLLGSNCGSNSCTGSIK